MNTFYTAVYKNYVLLTSLQGVWEFFIYSFFPSHIYDNEVRK